MSDHQKREMEQQLEQERWWPRPAGTISASLVLRGDEAPSEMRGAWAKWNRAMEHYNDLKRTAAEWLRKTWTIECDFDPDLGGHLATVRVQDDVLERLRIGMIAGDCFHSLRSALDFVMWELIHQQFRLTDETPPTDRRALEKLPNFPLAADDETLDGFDRRVRTKPISEPARNRIVDVHDFAENGAMPYLRYLRVLSNNDKHRVALVATAAVDLRPATFAVDPPDGEPEPEYLWNYGDAFEDGTRVAIVRFKDGPPHPDATVSVAERPHSVLQLKYADGSSGAIDLWTMTGVLLVVQDVLDRLQELFEQEQA